MLSHHDHKDMTSEIIIWTEGSKTIKNLMLELYYETLNWVSPFTHKRVTQVMKDASPFYSKVIVSNYMKGGALEPRHAAKIIGKVPDELLVAYKEKSEVLASKMAGIADLLITIKEINHNDHFLFELMAELMSKAGLSLHAASLEVRRIVLSHGKSSHLDNDVFFQNKLSEIAKPGEENIRNKRQISDLELDYSLEKLRLDTVDALMRDGSSADEAFDVVCQAEGQAMHEIVDAENIRRHQRAVEKRKAEAEAEADGVDEVQADLRRAAEKARKAANTSQVIASKENAEAEARKKTSESHHMPVIEEPVINPPIFETQITGLPPVIIHHHTTPDDMIDTSLSHRVDTWMNSSVVFIPISAFVLLTIAAGLLLARPISRCLRRSGFFATAGNKAENDLDTKHESAPLIIDTTDGNDSGTEPSPHSNRGEAVHRKHKGPNNTLITFIDFGLGGRSGSKNCPDLDTVGEAAAHRVTGMPRFNM